MAEYLIQLENGGQVTVDADDYFFDMSGRVLILTHGDSDPPVAIVPLHALVFCCTN